MRGRPVSRRSWQEPLESKQTCRSSQTDPETVTVVTARHSGPTRQTIFSKCSSGKIPGHAKQQRDSSKIERGTQKCPNSNPPQHDLERNGGIVSIQETGDSLAQQENP